MVFTKASSAGCCWCVSSARSESFLPLRAAGERDALPGLGPVSRSLALFLSLFRKMVIRLQNSSEVYNSVGDIVAHQQT